MLRGRHIEQLPPAAAQAEADIKTRQRQALDESHDVAELRSVGAHELAARRYVEEQIAHFDRRSRRMSRRANLRDGAPVHRDLRAVWSAGGTARQSQPGDRPDRWQRLAAKPEGGHRLQVLQRGDLAGGVSRDRDGQLLCRDPAAIVAYTHQADAAALDVDLDAVRACVETVLDELLDD